MCTGIRVLNVLDTATRDYSFQDMSGKRFFGALKGKRNIIETLLHCAILQSIFLMNLKIVAGGSSVAVKMSFNCTSKIFQIRA